MSKELNKKYLKVMFGNESSAGNGYKYKIGEINIAKLWNPNEKEPKKWEDLIFQQKIKF